MNVGDARLRTVPLLDDMPLDPGGRQLVSH